MSALTQGRAVRINPHNERNERNEQNRRWARVLGLQGPRHRPVPVLPEDWPLPLSRHFGPCSRRQAAGAMTRGTQLDCTTTWRSVAGGGGGYGVRPDLTSLVEHAERTERSRWWPSVPAQVAPNQTVHCRGVVQHCRLAAAFAPICFPYRSLQWDLFRSPSSNAAYLPPCVRSCWAKQ